MRAFSLAACLALAACGGDDDGGALGDGAPAFDGFPHPQLPDAAPAPTCDPVGPDAGGACGDEPIDGVAYVITDLTPPLFDLHLTSQHVYVAGEAGVYRADKCAGAGVAPTRIVDGIVRQIIADETDLYYATDEGIRVARDGEDPLFFARTGVNSMAQDDTAIYVHRGDLWRAPKDGSPATSVGWYLHPSAIDARGSCLYYIAHDSPSSTPWDLFSFDTAAGGKGVVAGNLMVAMAPLTPVADDTHVYMAGVLGITRVPAAGGLVEPLYDGAVDLFFDAPLAVDDTCVYYALHHHDAATNVWTAELFCLRKVSGASTLVFTTTGVFMDFAADASGVYVLGLSETTAWVARLPRPAP